MDPEEKREEIFTAAIEIEDRLERDAYVTRACGEDGQLLEMVQRLLHYHDGNSFLDTPALQSVTSPEISAPIEHPGRSPAGAVADSNPHPARATARAPAPRPADPSF